MTWEWSHTAEAYRDAETNLRDMPRDELVIIWAEWRACSDLDDRDYFDQEKYDAALNDSCALSDERLADDIWTQASELRECTNGGHFAHMCPYHCDPHNVAFDVHPERRGNDYC